MKTKILELNPTQVEITYLDKEGNPIKDSTQSCNNIYWEARFIGVDIDPLFVVSILPPALSYNTDKVQVVKTKVVMIDVTPEEAAAIKGAMKPIAQAEAVLEVAKEVVPNAGLTTPDAPPAANQPSAGTDGSVPAVGLGEGVKA